MSMNITKKTQKIGALYIRVSTDKQEELSPDAQIREGISYAQKNNIHVPKNYIFRDDGISGRKAEKRPDFQKLIGLAKSREHPLDCIIVWRFSRFARNQEESIVYKSLLKKNDVDVLSISEPLIEGPFGTLIERIIEWMDEYYSIRLSSEVIRGMTENAMRGKYQSDPPIGYKFAGAGLPPIKDPVTVPIVESSVKWLLDEKMTLRQIALRMNALGYKTKRGNVYEARTIRYILENPFYAGKVRWNYSGRSRSLKQANEVIYADGNWESLYPWDTYLLIQNRLKEIDICNSQRGTKKRDISSCKHWLCGSVICSACGRTLAQTGNEKNRGLQCWAYTKGMCKESHYVSLSQAEKYVITGLEHLLDSGEKMTYTIAPEAASASEKESELLKMLACLDEREKRAKNAYLNQIDTLEEYKETKTQITAARSRIRTEIGTISKTANRNDNNDTCTIRNVTEALSIIKDEHSDYTKKGMALRSILDKLIFDRKNTSFDFYLKLVK